MKYFNRQASAILLVVAFIFSSCKKVSMDTPTTASFTIGNFVVGGKTVRLNGTNLGSTNNSTVPTNFGLPSGENSLYIWPLGDSLHPYYVNPKFVCQANEIYTLFLHGPVASPEAIIIKENFPYRTDSTAGIRFINLSPNSTPLNITLSTSNTINEVSNLAYKQYTEFKTYPARYNTTYTFQVRDAATQAPAAPRASFTFNALSIPRFANVTLVIRGMVGSTPALGITRMNNDR